MKMLFITVSVVIVTIVQVFANTFVHQPIANDTAKENTCVFQNKCYQFVAELLDWQSAEQYCQSLGAHGHLAASTSAFINNYLGFGKTYSNCTSDVWIGGNRIQNGNTWNWSDGSPWSYTQWSPDFPSSQPLTNCVSMNIGNAPKPMWTNRQCSTPKPFVCESDATPTPPPCPPFWIYNPLLNNCYRIFSGLAGMSWGHCQQLCLEAGGNLTSIHSDEESEFINEISPVRFPNINWILTWIGFRDEHSQAPHQFTWIDGTQFNYTNFATIFGYPGSGSNYDCGFVFSNYNLALNVTIYNPGDYATKWGNTLCDSLSALVCACKRPTAQ